MKCLAALAILAFFALANAGENDVVILDDSNFDARLKDLGTALVMFYAPWCGHCKRLKPEFEKAGEILSADDPPISLAKVDCTEGGKDTCQRFGVSGYPTLKIFRDGDGESAQEYNGPREVDGIVRFMRAQVGPAAKSIDSEKSLDKFLDNEQGSIVGYFAEDSKLKSAFEKTAEALRETYRFALVTDKDVIAAKKAPTDGVVLHRARKLKSKFEPNDVTYEGEADRTSIQVWIKENYHGIAGHRTPDNSNQFKNPLVVAYYKVDYVKNPKGSNYWRNRVLSVAQSFADQISFAVSSKNDFQHELNEFGIESPIEETPFVAAWNEKKEKFVMDKEFSMDNLKEWVQKLVNGELTSYMKSEPVPDNSGPLKVAVAKNFDEVVINNGVDTLIEFYAPWCGHCKKLTPIYEELAEKLKDEKVAIVKMDATANDVPPQFEVHGFPTLYWAPKDAKDKPVKYQGGRELSDFLEYIATHSTDGLSKSKDEL